MGSGEGSLEWLFSLEWVEGGRREDDVATERLLLARRGYPFFDAEPLVMALGAEASEPNDCLEILPFANIPKASTTLSVGLK